MSALFRAKKTADFDKLYHRHAASVYRYALAILGNHADAEDVTQQTFLNAYRAIAQGTNPRKTENWLVTIAHNEVRRHFRARGNAVEVKLDERLAHPESEQSDPSLADVLRALQHLPPSQRSALVMREFEGRSYAEIAELLGVTQSALETLIFRARRALAEHLEGAITCAEAEQAFSRRLDGRLPRREARRLKAHLKECPLCVRFAATQKRQRSLLKGLSVMPIPVQLFFKGEPASAGGLGLAGAAASAAPVAAGGGAGGGVLAGGLGVGLVAKTAAAVTAAAAVTGGVGYGVATSREATANAPDSRVVQAAVAPPDRTAAAKVVPAEVSATRRAVAAKAAPARVKPAKVKAPRKEKVVPASRRAVEVKVHEKLKVVPPKAAAANSSRAKTPTRPVRPKPPARGKRAEAKKPKPARVPEKPKPPGELKPRVPTPPEPPAPELVEPGPKK